MHFRKALNSDHLAADDFVDAKTMEPVVRTLTVSGACMRKPRLAARRKLCLSFKETEKTAFLAATQISSLPTLCGAATLTIGLGRDSRSQVEKPQ